MAQSNLSGSIIVSVIIIITISRTESHEEGYLSYVKDGCFIKGEAFSCVKYKALKMAKKSFFGDTNSNETIRANQLISFVPLDDETIRSIEKEDQMLITLSQPRGFFSEWTELTKYFVKLVKDFFKSRGLSIELPDGAKTIEGNLNGEEGRGRRKKLTLIIPIITLLAAIKIKLLLIPILLSVLLIKKLLIAAAFLVPSLFNTLRACRLNNSPLNSYFGSSDSSSSDFGSGYSNTYGFSSGGGSNGGFGPKDWPTNRMYSMQKPRPLPSPTYITAPGGAA